MDAQQIIDEIIGSLQFIVQEEVSSLLGVEFLLTEVEKRSVSKVEVFKNPYGGKICTKVQLTGEVEGSGALLIDINDAILLAGTLIMLPGSELDEIIDREEYSAEIEDSFGEIAKLICNSFTSCFEEKYPKYCRFMKGESGKTVPGEVEIESDEPVQNEMFYEAGFSMVMDELPMGKMVMLLPAASFDMHFEDVLPADSINSGVTDISPQPSLLNDEVDSLDRTVDILLIGDDDSEVVKLSDVLENRGYAVQVVSLNDNVSRFMSSELKAVYLVTRDIDEQVFGMAIKVSSACSLPLIAAAPGWTKTKVIKAVKYGVGDILLTPASIKDIEENIVNNVARLAA